MNIPLWEGDRDAGVAKELIDPIADVAFDTTAVGNASHLHPEVDFEVQRIVTELRKPHERLGAVQDATMLDCRMLH